MTVSITRASCGNCPFWMRGVRRYGAGGGWKVTDAQGKLWDFGDCRRRAAQPEVGQDGLAWGRPHEDDWCGEHPRFGDGTADAAQSEARLEERP